MNKFKQLTSADLLAEKLEHIPKAFRSRLNEVCSMLLRCTEAGKIELEAVLDGFEKDCPSCKEAECNVDSAVNEFNRIESIVKVLITKEIHD